MSSLKPTEYNPGQPLERFSAERRRRGIAGESSAYGAGAVASTMGASMVGNAKIAGTKTGQYALGRAERHLKASGNPGAEQVASLRRIGAKAALHPKKATAVVAGLSTAAAGLGVLGRMRANEEAGISQGIGRIKAGESYRSTRQRTIGKGLARMAMMASDTDFANPRIKQSWDFANKHKKRIAGGIAAASGTSAVVGGVRASEHRAAQAHQMRSMSKSVAEVVERAMPLAKPVLKPVQGTGKKLISPKSKDVRNWTAGIVGGSAVGGGAAYATTHGDKKKAGAAVSGGLAGQGIYQGSAYGAKQYMRARTGQNLTRGKINSIRRGELKNSLLRADHADVSVNDARKKIKTEHIKANTLHGKTNWKEVHRTFPKALPYHRTERLLAHTHGGKTGMVVGGAATVGGGSLAMNAVGNRRPVDKMWKPQIKARSHKKIEEGLRSFIEPIDKPIVHHTTRAAFAGATAGGTFGAAATGAVIGRRQKVAKGLYQRESEPSLLRTAGLGAGLGVAAWGLGRSGMLGAALGRGVKAAVGRGDANALSALKQAQMLQGVLRRGTAPGERQVRQIRALNMAINAIPSRLRPEIATAAGLLLASNNHQVYRTHYRPVSTNVQFRRVF